MTNNRKHFPHRLRLPLVAAPMFLVSGPELVVAACRAGIIGSFPTPNARPIEQLEEWMRQITTQIAAMRAANPNMLIAPWSANLVTHSTNARLAQDLALVAEYQPPIVITALGGPKPALDIVHGYGGLVFADVTNIKLAKKAAQAGVDGLACIAAGAGGHTGTLSPFAFVSAVREFFDGFVIVGGGITDGHGVAAAIAAGADLVYMGTRFIAASESLANARYKQMLTECTAEDIVTTAAITGTPANWLIPSLNENGYDLANMPSTPERHYDPDANPGAKRWMNLWAAGQGVGTIKRVEPIGAMVDTLEQEFHAARERLAGWSGDPPRGWSGDPPRGWTGYPSGDPS